jgi:hypothetical protein
MKRLLQKSCDNSWRHRVHALQALCLIAFSLTSCISNKHQQTDGAGLISEGSHRINSSIPRRNYLFSVIPWGVTSAEELRSWRIADQVVAEHYVNFGSSVTFNRLPRETYFFISYRRGDKTFWTRQKHPLPKGELVFSDGQNLARARCGNRLSPVPISPTEIGGPPEAALNFPELPVPPEPTFPTLSVPVSYPLFFPDLPAVVSEFPGIVPPVSPGVPSPGLPISRGFVVPPGAPVSPQWLANSPQWPANMTGQAPIPTAYSYPPAEVTPSADPVPGALAVTPSAAPIPEPATMTYCLIWVVLFGGPIGSRARDFVSRSRKG